MKKSILFPVIIAALIVIGNCVSSAKPNYDRTPRIEARERLQYLRYRQGVRKGDLTRHEARILRRGERRIRFHEALAKADGRVTFTERRRLNRELDRESRRIHRLRHNHRTA